MSGGGALLGLLAGLGLLLAVSRLPALRRPTLEDRVGPYLRDQPVASRLLLDPSGTLLSQPTLERLFRPAISDLAARVDRVVGGSTSIQRRMVLAGRRDTVQAFRVEQVVWAISGLLIGCSVMVLLLLSGSGNPLGLLALGLGGGVAGLLARDYWLSREVKERERQIADELPTVAELLALAVTAGEAPLGALERVSASSTGALSDELRRALADTRAGMGLVLALEALADRVSVPAVARFVDGLAVAVERGTPLADVLRAQAVDAREAARRNLLEAGGKKEIGMLAPVVFLVLPVTVIFALFPAAFQLTLFAGG